jgi:DNA (cytosine-5)-methyltransferase 1
MIFGSLFSGIGGLELGLEMSGLGHTVWQVEQSQFCRNVLAKHWPSVERFDDVRTVGRKHLCPVDLICGGFPCQDISSAGKGTGLTGERSGLWFQFARIIKELTPSWVVVENVASGSKHWVDQVSTELEKLRYDVLPVPLSAEDVGAPHERERIFLIARNTNQDCEPVGSIDEEVAKLPETARDFPEWFQPPSVPMDDGFPDGMGAYGNAVVPQCAEVIGHIIKTLIREHVS